MLDFSILLPKDGTYADFMRHTAEPYLDAHRTEGSFSSWDRVNIHYEATLLSGAIGSVVISHGFVESAEKFREMTYWFSKMGYNVFAIDHRGHGRSHRIADDLALTDVAHFSDYVEDLHCFLKKIVKPHTKDLPLYLYGHSMGGAISILYLQKHPEVFAKTILTAPMLKPKTAGIPPPVTRGITGLLRIVGKGDRIVFIAKPGFNENERFENSPDTSEERFEYYRQKRLQNPYLQNSYPSYRWVNESLRIGRQMLNRSNCANITCPVLLFSAGKDDFVYRKEQERFISRIPNGKTVYEERARHEIYMSTNDVMAGYLSQIECFLKDQVK